MTKPTRLLLALLLLAAAFGLRAPYLRRAIWNVDEGITASAAEQILAGGVLYRDVADQRSPLVPYLKAGIFAVAGDWNTTAVHAVLAILLGLGAVALWQLARRLGHERAGVAAAVVFTVLCFMLPGGDDTLAAHTEWFLVVFSIAGFWALAAALDRPGFRRGLGVGALFALAALSKQPGLFDWAVALVLIGLLVVFGKREQRGSLLRLAGGAVAGLVLVMGGVVAYFAHRGALPDLIYYTWTYNNQVYVPAVPLPERLLTMREPFRLAAQNVPVVLGLGLLGALLLPVVAFRGLCRRPAEVRLLVWLALGWTASGLYATSLSGRGFSHYSIQVIPGLSLVAGVLLAAGWDWCAARARAWRIAGAVLLVLAAAETGAHLARRIRVLVPDDWAWTENIAVVRRLTRPDDRVFFWGFAPDCYVQAQRRPATRFVYTTFLTGMIPWTNLDPLVDTAAIVTPGSWAQLQEDFRRTPPAMIIDTGSVRNQSKYPMHDQPVLWSLVTRDFAEVHVLAAGIPDLRFYRRLAAGGPGAVPVEAVADGTVKLEIRYTRQVRSVPQLALSAPSGASRVDLFLNGQLCRSLDLADGRTDIAFFAPLPEPPVTANVFTAVVHYPTGARLSAPVTLTAMEAFWHAHHAPGPAILFLGREIRPSGSETREGQPLLTGHDPEVWRTHAPARLVYERPAGLRSFQLRFGLDPDFYYDKPDRRASDGVDFVVEYVDGGGATSRLFTRRLHPKTDQADCGTLHAEIALPSTGAGQIVIRALPGAANDEQFDWAYLQTMTATAYGPPAAGGDQAIPAERVSAHGDPVMTRDPEGKWTAHSPSSVTYEPPPGAAALVFSYGLEPASYDGSQGGRTDGIEVTVTAERADGATTTLFHRTLDPANVAADRGRQTTRIQLTDTNAGRVTIAIGPGPNNNFSYDWSFLADVRFESATAHD